MSFSSAVLSTLTVMAPFAAPAANLSATTVRLLHNNIDCQYFDLISRGGVAAADKVWFIQPFGDGTASTAMHSGSHIAGYIFLLAAVCALALFTVVCLTRIRELKTSIHHLKINIHQLRHKHGHKNYEQEAEAEAAAEDEEDESYRPYENRSLEYERVFISRLNTLIEENLCNHDMSVDFLATKMLISRSLLFSRVKRIAGKSVVEYINDFRIAKAKELLRDEKLNLTEISELVGFSSLRYFSRVFKQSTGESPSVYRQHIADN